MQELTSVVSTSEFANFSYGGLGELQAVSLARSFLNVEASAELQALRVAIEKLSGSESDLVSVDRSLSAVHSAINGVDPVHARSLLTASIAARKEIQLLRQKGERLPEPVSQMDRLLERIAEQTSILKAYSDLPLLTADGLNRGYVRVMAPAILRSIRESRGLHAENCDLLIIGGGPAGIATTYYAGRAGVDTVLLEANYLASSMSDGRALPVKLMRTSPVGTSLAREGIAPEELAHEIGMPELMERTGLREIAQQARQTVEASTGVRFPRFMPEGPLNPRSSDPATRAETYAYFNEVADLAANSSNVLIAEQEPVSQVTWVDSAQRFEVTTTNGQRLCPKYLVFSGGIVGEQAEFARRLPVVDSLIMKHPGQFIAARSDSEFQTASAQLEQQLLATSTELPGQLVISDPVLGQPLVQYALKHAPAGTRHLCIGSGESAAKSALHLLRASEHASVDLIVKSSLEPALGQNPALGVHADLGIQAIADRDFGQMTLEILRNYFGTPITSETMMELLEEVQNGRLKIFELGAHFDENSIELSSEIEAGRFVTRVRLREPAENSRASLAKQLAEWQEVGLIEKEYKLFENAENNLLTTTSGIIVTAAGYDRNMLREANPLFKQLEAQGLVTRRGQPQTNEIETDSVHGLFSAANPQLAFAGATILHGPIDGVFSGGGLRGLLLADAIGRQLGYIDSQTPKVVDYSVAASGVTLAPARELKRPNSNNIPSRRFIGTPHLVEIARKEKTAAETLSAAEKLLLKRGDQLHTRMNGLLGPNGMAPL